GGRWRLVRTRRGPRQALEDDRIVIPRRCPARRVCVELDLEPARELPAVLRHPTLHVHPDGLPAARTRALLPREGGGQEPAPGDVVRLEIPAGNSEAPDFVIDRTERGGRAGGDLRVGLARADRDEERARIVAARGAAAVGVPVQAIEVARIAVGAGDDAPALHL